MINHVSPITDRPPYPLPGSMSPEANRPGTGYAKGRPGHIHYSPKDGSGSPYTPITNTPPTGFPSGPPNGVDGGYMHHEASYRPPHHSPNGPPRQSVQTNVGPYGVLSPVSTQHGYHSQHNTTPQSGPYVPQQGFDSFNLPPSNFSNGSPAVQREAGPQYAATSSAEYPDQGHAQQPSEMMMLDHMSMPTTIPVFGTEGIMNKSPYVSIPEDFVAYLFNTHQGEGSPMSQMVPQGYSKLVANSISPDFDALVG